MLVNLEQVSTTLALSVARARRSAQRASLHRLYMHGDTSGHLVVVVGVLSTVGDFGCQFEAGKPYEPHDCRSTGTLAAYRRQRLRQSLRTSNAWQKQLVDVRFLVASCAAANSSTCAVPPPLYMPPLAADAVRLVQAEALEFGDVLLLAMGEDALGGCSRKYLLWLAHAVTQWPDAAFIALADDDVYIQWDHLGEELALQARVNPGSNELVYWGLLFWRYRRG